MDILGELKGAMEQRVVEMTPPEGLSASTGKIRSCCAGDPVSRNWQDQILTTSRG